MLQCINVQDGVNTDGTKLQIDACVEGNKNQEWVFVNSTLQWSSTDKCIEPTDGNITDGNTVEINTCDSHNPNQKWVVEVINNATQSVIYHAFRIEGPSLLSRIV